MEGQFQSKTTEAANLTVKDIFFKYIRFLPLVFLSVALAFMGAYVYLRYATPVYSSSGALIIKGDNGSAGGSGDKFSQLFVLDNSLNLQNEIELLRSRQLMEEVVKGLNLNFTYHAIGKISQLHLYNNEPFKLVAYKINDSSSAFHLQVEVLNDQQLRVNGEKTVAFGQLFTNNYGSFRFVKNNDRLIDRYTIDWQPTRSVAGDLASRVEVYPKGPTGIMNISLESTHPRLAADVINRLMLEYKIATLNDKNETKRQTIDFIDGRLKVISKELDSVNYSLLRYQEANNLINSESLSASLFSRIEGNDQQIMDQRVQINVAEMIDTYLRDQNHAYELVPSSLGLSDATLGTMISAYNVAQLDRKALIDANIPVTNSRVKQKEDQIERLRINILESLDNIKKFHTAAITRLERNTTETRSKMESLPLKEQNLLEIKKQQQMKQGIYNFLLEKREDIAMSLAATISNIKVVEEAFPNKTPVSPNRKNIYLIAIIIGLAIPALIIFVSEILNDKVSSRYDVEKVTSVPIIAEIGHSLGGDTLAVKANNRSMVAEQFRIMRSNLQYVLANMPKPVLLVTSSYSGEGKSFISTNLGAVISLANKKTIILEFDIRKPKILSGLGMPKKPGLTNYLLGKVSLDELPIEVSGHDNLYVLPCGPVPPNPSELLLDTRIKELFLYLKQNFDVIVIDTAPVGMVSDALTLSEFADATLYLVRQRYTQKNQLGLIDELARERKLPKVSIVLNDVKVRTGYGYSGYGRYGYGYGSVYGNGNGNGYFDDEAPASTFMKRWFGWADTKRWKHKNNKKVKV
ncbi:polysaccharide biosynthesis tyrosine autokinase [Chitinophagaceae bacterium LB-8]|uniref:Polysaccharide biosynthesis tyrosine autokinase n=1 Tax=Paraflavisolibacter caeni TaxID=2982496 RepID=A0A9X2XY29_9BACT|nr:polysaccharide biosynthesis tyrosine autokinase [Paraflavisolibacter caeni]MCU7551280.1 polysaccharide biosynthesis tyrosine autokinase [Paraflavisolibacter caeni]